MYVLVCVHTATIRGRGDYVLSGNAVGGAGGTTLAGEVPKFTAGSEGSVRVTHKEYLGELRTIGNDFNNAYVKKLNPGLADTFPWLSTIAANFEEYEFHGLTFVFVSESADALSSTNTALGSVMMATQYNANLLPLRSKEEMLAYEFSNTGRPSSSMIHMVECARRRTVLPEMYVRTGDVPQASTTPQDYRLYDWGTFQVATQGQQAACILGELWVTYDVILRKPRLPIGGSVASLNKIAVWRSSQADHSTFKSGYVNWPALTPASIFFPGPAGTADAYNALSMFNNASVSVKNIVFGAGYGTQFTFNPAAGDEYFMLNICYLLGSASDGIYLETGLGGTSNCAVAKFWNALGSGPYSGPPFTYSLPVNAQEEFVAPGAATSGQLHTVQILIRVKASTTAPYVTFYLTNDSTSSSRVTDPGITIFDMTLNSVNPLAVQSYGDIPWSVGTV